MNIKIKINNTQKQIAKNVNHIKMLERQYNIISTGDMTCFNELTKERFLSFHHPLIKFHMRSETNMFQKVI